MIFLGRCIIFNSGYCNQKDDDKDEMMIKDKGKIERGGQITRYVGLHVNDLFKEKRISKKCTTCQSTLSL